MDLPDHVPQRPWPPGWHVEHVAVTGSTNEDLVRAAATGAADRTVLIAGFQTAGRGRLDRRWDAPPGTNLLVSILFRSVPDPPIDAARRVGLAALAAIRETAGVEAALKWPNDLLLGGRKLGGILAEHAPGDAVVVGLGLNIGWAPPDAARLGATTTPDAVLQSLLRAHDRLPDDVHDLYVQRLDTLGRRIVVKLPAGELHGTAIGVERDGRLVVLDDCAVSHRVDVGDVVELGLGDPTEG